MQRTGAHKVTIKDVAAASNISYQAVSLALRGRRGVSERTRSQVRRVAAELGYFPNAAAQRLPSKGANQLGIVAAGQQGFRLAAGLLEPFAELCERTNHQYHMEILQYTGRDGPFKPPYILSGGLVDGVILVGDVGPSLREWLDERMIPWVSIYEVGPYCVLPDGEQGVRIALEHLAALGHRRVAAWFGPLRYMAHCQRHDAFISLLAEMGLELGDPRFIGIGDAGDGREHLEQSLAWSRHVLDSKNRPTAVIGAARGMIHAALERGLQVGRDLSLIDWLPPYEARSTYYPAMTALHADLPAMMSHAMDLLGARLAGKPAEPATRWVPTGLFVGQSTGRVG